MRNEMYVCCKLGCLPLWEAEVLPDSSSVERETPPAIASSSDGQYLSREAREKEGLEIDLVGDYGEPG